MNRPSTELIVPVAGHALAAAAPTATQIQAALYANGFGRRVIPGGGATNVALAMPKIGKRKFIREVLASLSADPNVSHFYTTRVEGNQLVIEPAQNAVAEMDPATCAKALEEKTLDNESRKIAMRQGFVAHVNNEITTQSAGMTLDTNEAERRMLANRMLGDFMTRMRTITGERIKLRNQRTGLGAFAGKVGRSRFGKIGKALGFAGLTTLGAASTGGLALGAHLGAGLLGRNAALRAMDKGAKGPDGLAREINRLVRDTRGENIDFRRFDKLGLAWSNRVEERAAKIAVGGRTSDAIRDDIARIVMEEIDSVTAHLEDKQGLFRKIGRQVLAVSGAAALSFAAGGVANETGLTDRIDPAASWVADRAKDGWDAISGGKAWDAIKYGANVAWDAAGDQINRVF